MGGSALISTLLTDCSSHVTLCQAQSPFDAQISQICLAVQSAADKVEQLQSTMVA